MREKKMFYHIALYSKEQRTTYYDDSEQSLENVLKIMKLIMENSYIDKVRIHISNYSDDDRVDLTFERQID